MQPKRCLQCQQTVSHHSTALMELPHEKIGRHIRPCNRNPKHAAQQKQHEGYPRFCGKHDLIQTLGAAIPLRLPLHNRSTNLLRTLQKCQGTIFLKFRRMIATLRFGCKCLPINALGVYLPASLRHLRQQLLQCRKPHPLPCRHFDDRHPRHALQACAVYGNALLLCLIRQIQAKNDILRQLHNLQPQGQIPLQRGRIQNDKHNIRLLIADKILGGTFLRKLGKQGINPRQVIQLCLPCAQGNRPHRIADGFPRPVARMLL